MEDNDTTILWPVTIKGTELPAVAKNEQEIVPFAKSLTHEQQLHIIQAVGSGAYDMASEYVWKKSMIRLRSVLKSLGMKFIGEMMGRPDIEEGESIHRVLNDYNTIVLAEQLNIINSTAALKLKTALDYINHFFSDNATKDQEKLDYNDCIAIIKSCVKYLLIEPNIEIAVEFSQFRNKLTTSTLSDDDPQLEQIASSSIFFIRTCLVILLDAVRQKDKPALQEHSLANLITLLPKVWNTKLRDDEKYMLGFTYRDVVASGNNKATNGIKAALLKVKGFDYVPETLRSNTFIAAAHSLIDAHFEFDNFYNETAPAEKLANLGTSIPAPAFANCMTAYLCVCIGNTYGISRAAYRIASEQLSHVPQERWKYYLESVLPSDEIILEKLSRPTTASRFIALFKGGVLKTHSDLKAPGDKIVQYIEKGATDSLNSFSAKLLARLKPVTE